MSSVKEQLTTLVALQQAEVQIGRVEKELAGIDNRIDAMNTEITEFEERVNQGQSALDALKKDYRSSEVEVQSIEGQIIKSEEKLRAVKTNKEYQATLKEIEDFKQKASGIEDKMLEYLDSLETAETEVATQQADLADVKADVTIQQEEIRQKGEQQRLSLEGYQEERNAIWENINPKLQDMYSRVKIQSQGIAIAAVEESVCLACRMNIPPQLYIELLRMNDTLRMCPHCQRIIYPKAMLEEG